MRVDKTKLYAGLSLKERAKLYFKNMVGGSESVAVTDDIMATIPKGRYIINEPAFVGYAGGLYYASMLWGFQYQKWKGIHDTNKMIVVASSLNETDKDLKQIAKKSRLRVAESKDKLELLFLLVDELDKSRGFDASTVFSIAEVRCEEIEINHNCKDKNQACKAYYFEIKGLLLQLIDRYETASGNIGLESENEALRDKLKQFEPVH